MNFYCETLYQGLVRNGVICIISLIAKVLPNNESVTRTDVLIASSSDEEILNARTPVLEGKKGKKGFWQHCRR